MNKDDGLRYFHGFDWSLGNKDKAQKHGLKIQEIESLFRSQIFVTKDLKHSQEEERFIGIGETEKGKVIFVVFTYRWMEESLLIRVISARPIHKKGKEREFYEKLKKRF